MSGPAHRQWMYPMKNDNGLGVRDEFCEVVDEFERFAQSQDEFLRTGMYRCPCRNCHNMRYKPPMEVKGHLLHFRFTPGYWYWTCYGENKPTHFWAGRSSNETWGGCNSGQVSNQFGFVQDQMSTMMNDAMHAYAIQYEDMPENDAAHFFSILHLAQEPLYDGCKISAPDVAIRLLSIKSDYNLSHKCLDDIIRLLGDIILENNRLPKNCYDLKKKVKELGMEVREIDCCLRGCMLYYNGDEQLSACKFCSQERWKPIEFASNTAKRVPFAKMHYLPPTARLQRLFASKRTARHMRWHAECLKEDGVLRNLFDEAAWKHFDSVHLDFVSEPRNVRLGLIADGFTPFSLSSRPYSIWPILVTPYNLPQTCV